MHDYLLDLNETQQEAVKYLDGPQLIIAGAGSGKTRVLTYKIVHLLNSGYSASSILALTFTNKAAREMKERMASLVPQSKVSSIWMGTFHSIFAKILRVDGQFIGYPNNFTIYDTDDAKKIIKEIINELNLDTEQYPVGEIYSRISKAKNNLVLPDYYEKDSEIQKQDFMMKRPETSEIYKRYQAKCKANSAMDFDDLLVNTNILFRDVPQVLEKYQKIFKFILVDEYQDTNYSQYIILKRLSSGHKKICAVGDDSQSIYAFRGAKIENILNFKTDFPNHKIYKLEQNYRSTQNIVNLANKLIEKNQNRIPKTIFTENESGEKVKIVENIDDKAEALFVTKQLFKSKKNLELNYGDIAILYRTNAQSRSFEDVLRKYNVPYKIFGSISFYQRSEIKDVVAYLRFIVNKNDDLALKRIINYPKRGIGDTTIDKLQEIATVNSVSIWTVLQKTDFLAQHLTARTIGLLNNFVAMINSFSAKSPEMNAKELVDFVISTSGIKQHLSSDRSPEGISKFDNVQEFTNAVQEYIEKKEQEGIQNVPLELFLEEIALATDQDTKDDKTDSVTLMTIHASKGLEFKVIFIVGVEEGLFPSFRSVMNPSDIEEERRLFYVAITRSRNELFISYCRSRRIWGNIQPASPSRFVAELDKSFTQTEKFLQEEKLFDNSIKKDNFAKSFVQKSEPVIQINSKPKNLTKINTTPKSTEQTKNFDPQTGLAVGMTVEHEKFGIGVVVTIEGEFPESKATVDFKNAGKKNLLLKFAKLNIIKN